jgi:riboflavin kinase/FMN adenylyltransferase
MIIHKGKIESFDIPENLALAIGNFDGMHLGHQKVINSCIEIAKQNNLTPAVLTFHPHPDSIINPASSEKKLMCNTATKVKLMDGFVIPHLFLLDFNTNLMEMTSDEFIEKILIEKFRVKAVVTGYNFHFGYKKLGNITTLKNASEKHGFIYRSVKQLTRDNCEISSSRIRKLLKLGAIETVNQLIGREYTITGEVIHGKKIAKTIDCQTANIALKEDLCYPLNGVYLVELAISGKQKFGVANIGIRPTVSDENTTLLEVHIFDFAEDIYGEILEIKFLHFLRPERKFKNIESLKVQVQKDISDAQYALKNIKRRP